MRGMNRRRALLALTALGSCVVLPWARAQAPATLPKVALFTFGSRYNARSRTEAFFKAIRELGYEASNNIHHESHQRALRGVPFAPRMGCQALARAARGDGRDHLS